MELAELQAFVQVVQSGSFTRAAGRLGTQKSHLSRVVAALERRLGVRLLERSTRAMHLTEIGREVFERAVGILGAVEDTERMAQQLSAEPRGTLRLTCGVEFGLLAVNRWIHAYLVRYPQVAVEADYTGRVVDLVHEGFDLAIRLGELADSRLAARRLGELDYGLYASPDYLARRGEPGHAGELAGHALLAFSGGARRAPWRLQRGDEAVAIEGTGRLRVNNSHAVRDAALAGLGIAALPRRLAQPALTAGALKALLADWELPRVAVHAVFASSRYLTPKLRSFIDLATAGFDEGAPA
jgi:DNA-binding transcriptional LysR family regulator